MLMQIQGCDWYWVRISKSNDWDCPGGSLSNVCYMLCRAPKFDPK